MKSVLLLIGLIMPSLAQVAPPIVESDFSGFSSLDESDHVVFERWAQSVYHFSNLGDVSARAEQALSAIDQSPQKSSLLAQRDLLRASRANGLEVAASRLLYLAYFEPEFVDIKKVESFISRDLKRAMKTENIKISRIQNLEEELKRLKANGEDLLAKQKNHCHPRINLSEKMGPVKHQGELSWCFAFAIADVLSYHLKSDVSPSSVAFAYSQRHFAEAQKRVELAPFQSGIYYNGFTDQAIQALLQGGVFCREKDMPSQALTAGHKEANLKHLYFEIETFKNAVSHFPEVKAPYCQNIYNRVASKLFPGIKLSEFEEIFSKTQTQRLLTQLSVQNCAKNPIKIPENLKSSYQSVITPKGPRETMRVVDEFLAAKSPMVVELNHEVVQSDNPKPGLSRMLDHSVVISGKRWNDKTKKCELNVRDSATKSEKWIAVNDLAPAILRVSGIKHRSN